MHILVQTCTFYVENNCTETLGKGGVGGLGGIYDNMFFYDFPFSQRVLGGVNAFDFRICDKMQ